MSAYEDMGAALSHLLRRFDRKTHHPLDLVDALAEDHLDTVLAWLAELGVLRRSEFVQVTRRTPDKPSASGWGGELVTTAHKRPGAESGAEQRLWRVVR